MTGLETKIFNYIECIYDCKFTGKVKVEITDYDYCLALTLNNYMIPLYAMCYQIETFFILTESGEIINTETWEKTITEEENIVLSDEEEAFYQHVKKDLRERQLNKTGYFRLKLDRDDQ